MSKGLVSRCPFAREGTASRKIYLTLAQAKKAMHPKDVAQVTRLPLGKVQTLLAAYRNVFHAAPLRRAGVKMELNEDGYFLKTTKAEPNAKRPPRGMKPKQAAAKPAKKTIKPKPKAKSASKPKKAKTTPSAAAAPAPVPDTSVAPVGDLLEAAAQ